MLIPVLLLAMPYWNRASIVVSPLLFVGMAAIAFYQDTKLLADYSRDPSFTGELEVYWSPYQKIEYVNTDSLQHRIHVNGIGHQKMEQLTTIAESYYSQIYKFREEEGKPPVKEVLILGAGSGNDVAAALQQNVDHVDAVEIDPVIGKLGLLHHPAGPYKDSRVNLVIDDGRAFMNRTKRHYDLIIFALTDSLVKVSPMAQLRLENYLFTEESFAKAYSLLEPQGDLVFYNSYRREWLVQKLKTMVMRTTGKQPIRHTKIGRDMTVLSVGDDYPVSAEPENLIAKATDDWPFFYMRERKIPRLYLYAMTGITILIIALLWFLERSTRNQRYEQGSNAKLSIKLAFLFMGVAFLLLETKSIIQFSLLFGTTWLNNSLVFLGVLVSVLIANWIATLLPKKGLWIYFALLIASCLIVFVYPLGNLLFVESGFVRFALASVMTFSPIFFANLIFAVLFREQKVAEHIFGWNLIGATLGGVIEYTSIAFGYNSLAIIVMLCYMAVLANVLVWKRQTAQAAIPTTFV